jgi:hypothetical protein
MLLVDAVKDMFCRLSVFKVFSKDIHIESAGRNLKRQLPRRG